MPGELYNPLFPEDIDWGSLDFQQPSATPSSPTGGTWEGGASYNIQPPEKGYQGDAPPREPAAGPPTNARDQRFEQFAEEMKAVQAGAEKEFDRRNPAIGEDEKPWDLALQQQLGGGGFNIDELKKRNLEIANRNKRRAAARPIQAKQREDFLAAARAKEQGRQDTLRSRLTFNDRFAAKYGTGKSSPLQGELEKRAGARKAELEKRAGARKAGLDERAAMGDLFMGPRERARKQAARNR